MSDNKTCALCGRTVDKDLAKKVPIVGHVGSTCYTKVAAIREVMTYHALGFLLDGAIRVTREMVDNREVVIPKNYEYRARQLGLDVSMTPDGPDAFVLTPTLRSAKKLRKAIRS